MGLIRHTYDIWMHHGKGKLHETTTSPTYQEHSFLDRGTQLPMFTVKGCYLCLPGKPKYSNAGWHSTAILALTRQHETIQCTWILWHKLNVFVTRKHAGPRITPSNSAEKPFKFAFRKEASQRKQTSEHPASNQNWRICDYCVTVDCCEF